MTNYHSDLDEVYLFQMERAVRSFRKYAQEKLDKAGIPVTGDQWVVLKRIHEQPGIVQKELAEATYKDPASLTRITELLVKRGLIERQRSTVDRRVVHLHLSTEGKALVVKTLPLAVKIRRDGLKGFSKTEQRILVGLLERMHQNFS